MTTRFVALGVETSVCAALDDAVAPLRERLRGFAWTDPAGWHVTLAFLGRPPESSRVAVLRAVERAVAAARAADRVPRSLTLGGTEAWGARALVVGVEDEPTGSLAALGGDILSALAAEGLGIQTRPVRPHLTLARARRGREVDDDVVARIGERLVSGRWEPRSVAVWSSHPRPGAPARYVVDDEVALRR